MATANPMTKAAMLAAGILFVAMAGLAEAQEGPRASQDAGGYDTYGGGPPGDGAHVRGDACRPMFPEPIAMRTFCDGRASGTAPSGIDPAGPRRRPVREMRDGVPVVE